MRKDGLYRATDGGSWHRITTLPAINYAWGTLLSSTSPQVAWLREQGRARGSTPGGGGIRSSSSPTARCFVTADAGNTWQQHDVPNTGTSTGGRERDDITVNAVDGLNSTSAWALVVTVHTRAGGGEESIASTEVRLIHTGNAGALWSVIRDEQSSDSSTSVPAGGAYWITAGTSGALYVSGYSDGIDRSIDSGRSWTTLTVPFPPGGDVGADAYCSLSERGAVVTVTEREVVSGSPLPFYETSSDGGATWAATTGPAAVPALC